MNNPDVKLLDMYKKERFPRSSEYDLDWVFKNEMGPNVLWLTELLCESMDLKSGMRVLDLGCGTGMSSIFLAREFGVEVWAADLWIKPTDNYNRIKEAGLDGRIHPIHLEAHSIPFAEEYFDAIVSLDSYHYYGTDVHYLEFHLLKHLKHGGQLGIVSPASPTELPDPLPSYMPEDFYFMNSLEWWSKHWSRMPGFTVELAEMLPGGFELWLEWTELLEAYGNANRPQDVETELPLLRTDQGRYIGFVRMVGRRT